MPDLDCPRPPPGNGTAVGIASGGLTGVRPAEGRELEHRQMGRRTLLTRNPSGFSSSGRCPSHPSASHVSQRTAPALGRRRGRKSLSRTSHTRVSIGYRAWGEGLTGRGSPPPLSRTYTVPHLSTPLEDLQSSHARYARRLAPEVRKYDQRHARRSSIARCTVRWKAVYLCSMSATIESQQNPQPLLPLGVLTENRCTRPAASRR